MDSRGKCVLELRKILSRLDMKVASKGNGKYRRASERCRNAITDYQSSWMIFSSKPAIQLQDSFSELVSILGETLAGGDALSENDETAVAFYHDVAAELLAITENLQKLGFSIFAGGIVTWFVNAIKIAPRFVIAFIQSLLVDVGIPATYAASLAPIAVNILIAGGSAVLFFYLISGKFTTHNEEFIQLLDKYVINHPIEAEQIHSTIVHSTISANSCCM